MRGGDLVECELNTNAKVEQGDADDEVNQEQDEKGDE